MIFYIKRCNIGVIVLLSVENIAYLADIIKLPKETLRDICTNVGVPNEGANALLAERIWRSVQNNDTKQKEILGPYRNKIFCGRTSVTWYQMDAEGDLRGTKQTIIDNMGFNPFEAPNIPPHDQLSSTPVIVSAAPGVGESDYYLRFMYKSRVSQFFNGMDMVLTSKSNIVTVYVDEEKGYIEIRTDPKTSEKVASSLASLIKQEVALSQVIVPFGHNIEAIADRLDGEISDATGKPELVLEEMTEEQAGAVVRILTALDSYFEDGDTETLQQELFESREELETNDYIALPFTALILSGLDKVGMGVTGRGLKGTPLFDYIKPYLQYQGGFIKFSVEEEGIKRPYTVRLGLANKSVFFVTPATENALQFLRDRLL